MAAMKEHKDGEKLIVGLGASAGGLDPILEFVDSLPDKTGMSFIIVMHLDPDYESKIDEVLQPHTQLNTQRITEGCKIKSDHIYIIPPDKLLFVKDNFLELSDPEKNEQSLTTIDSFFRSLGNTAKRNAASIVFSGTGADGSVGLKAVKEQGGLTISQYPDEAKYSSMPRSALNTGVVDKVLRAKEMYRELEKYKQNLSQVDLSKSEDRDEILRAISDKLKSETGHDFSNYKESTVLRRIERRMQVNNCLTFRAYLKYLDEHPEENEELFKDLLISVTSFFRDSGAFHAFKNRIIPELFAKKDPEDQLRVWVPGTATGEEAYSIAILLRDYMYQENITEDIQIFGSDIDQSALDKARKGVYPESIAASFTTEQLNRYFERVGYEYHINEEISNMVLFTFHNLLSDPPFSNLDLIACRNVLIYLKKDIQTEVFQLFKYALRPGGWLFLGMSDSSIGAGELFDSVDKKHRIYQKDINFEEAEQPPQLPLYFKNDTFSMDEQTGSIPEKKTDIEQFHKNMLMRLYTPQSVIINKSGEVIDATEDIQQFLEYKGDPINKKIMEMVKPELHKVLQTLISRVKREGISTGREKAMVDPQRNGKKVEITVRNIGHTGFAKNLMQIVFKEQAVSHQINKAKVSQYAGDKNPKDVIEELENELEETREQLHLTEEEYRMANEQLRTSNEELQSVNEELKSVNEELETSQEELQSVNKELEMKVQELRRLNSDLHNLMKATEIAILMLNKDFHVQRFNDSATNIFNLISSDEGRPLNDVTHILNYDSIREDMYQVLDTLENIEKVVTSREGEVFVMRLTPYRSVEDEVEGVVLSFMEITELKEAEEKLKQQEFQEALVTMGTYALSGNDLKSIVDRAQQQICAALKTDYSIKMLWNSEEQVLQLFGWDGWQPNDEDVKVEPDEQWDVGYAFEKEGPVVVSDYATEERFRLLPFLNRLDITSGVVIRIVESDQICGILGVYSKEKKTFTDEELKFIQNVAHIVGMASERIKTRESLEISNRKLEQEIKRSEQYQREILQNSIAERWNLGGYLHDNLAQDLVSIKVMISSLKSELEDSGLTSHIDMILENIDQGIDDIRNLTHEIIPVDIEDEGVEHAFRLLVRQLQKTHDINCILEVEEVIDQVRDKEVATNLYHIIQEAVKNAAIHGKAENVIIETIREDDNLKLQITDDGVGLSKAKSDNAIGSGTNIMRHRIELLGGSFHRAEITKEGKTGTCVVCTLPLERLKKQKNK